MREFHGGGGVVRGAVSALIVRTRKIKAERMKKERKKMSHGKRGQRERARELIRKSEKGEKEEEEYGGERKDSFNRSSN